MGRTFLCGSVAAICSLAGFGQSFEVASVKPTPPPEPGVRVFYGPPRGGPGTSDPGQITWASAALRSIVMLAYDVQTFQVTAPDWLAAERYDIAAKVPPGATKQQVNVMWQNLLKERFGMIIHHESKEFQVQELTVAKGGPKLKPTDLGPSPEPFTPAPGPRKLDKNGSPEMNGFGAIVTIFPDGPRARMDAKGLTMADFASRMAGFAGGHPVLDKTGLTGRYDFVLEFTPDLTGIPMPAGVAGPRSGVASEPAATVAAAVEQQLGLKLTAARAMLDVIVVDRAEKIPTAN